MVAGMSSPNSTALSKTLRPNELLDGRFKIIQQIAAGGMGAVFRARDVVSGDAVAIKVLHPHFAADPEAIARFKQEARAIEQLEHPGIIKTLGHGVDARGRLYLAMEWLEGCDLSTLIEDEGPLAPNYAAWIVMQAAQALDFAHQQSIIHRDIKPENIFINHGATPSQDRAKVLDFGVAKIHDDQDSNITRAGTVCGTPQYMGPEQARADVLDGRSDLYSLGCLLYAMLAGHDPFGNSTPMEAMIKQQLDPLPALPAALEIPAALEAILQRATQKKREHRQASTQVFTEQLRAFLRDEPIVELEETPDADTQGPSPQLERLKEQKSRSSAAQMISNEFFAISEEDLIRLQSADTLSRPITLIPTQSPTDLDDPLATSKNHIAVEQKEITAISKAPTHPRSPHLALTAAVIASAILLLSLITLVLVGV